MAVLEWQRGGRWQGRHRRGTAHTIAQATGVRHLDGRNSDARAIMMPIDCLWVGRPSKEMQERNRKQESKERLVVKSQKKES
jgi:hypothetical protein